MADLIDTANDRAQEQAEDALAAIRRQAAQIPAGNAGHCDLCGEWSGRLVRDACARCRDQLRLP
jgi:hypothetical protein